MEDGKNQTALTVLANDTALRNKTSQMSEFKWRKQGPPTMYHTSAQTKSGLRQWWPNRRSGLVSEMRRPLKNELISHVYAILLITNE